MQPSTTLNPATESPRNTEAKRIAKIAKLLPVIGIALLVVVVLAAIAFAWVRVVMLIIGALIAGAAVIGGLYQAYAVRRDRRAHARPGVLADAGGFNLHLLVMGEDTGKPTVILEGGMAAFALNWHWAQTELAQDTRVVAYDRAGFGWSDTSPSRRDAQTCARELRAALSSAGITGPYVLAGWSFGGLVVRVFADLYPNEVVGLVLVDASHPDQWKHMPIPNADRILARMMRFQGELCRFGYGRVVKGAAKLITSGMPPDIAAPIVAHTALRSCWVTESQQAAAWNDHSRPQINTAKPLGDLPVMVLGVSEQPLFGDELTRLQDELMDLSSNSARRIVEGATHESLVARSEYAAQVSQSIRQVILAAQTGQPLASVQQAIQAEHQPVIRRGG
ncbi:MAG: alpha/beta hydrolase [Chloroflexi bacterium]|nr:alpha/beta hydrolase [Chloroflexota bacterium]